MHLIDYMQDLIKTVKEGDMTNFQVISELNYLYFVDFVWITTETVHQMLNMSSITYCHFSGLSYQTPLGFQKSSGALKFH